MGDVPMPAFLDPRKVQEEAQSRQSDAPRSGNRVDVTRASINEAGRVDAANAPAVPMPAPASESVDETVPELQAKPLDIPDVSVAPVDPVTLHPFHKYHFLRWHRIFPSPSFQLMGQDFHVAADLLVGYP